MIKILKKVTYVIITMSSFIGFNASCLNLHEALISTYKTNEDFKKAQLDFINNLENFSQALAQFLPDISLQYSWNKNENTNISHFSSIYIEPYKSEQSSLNLSQNVFHGGSDVLNLKACQLQFLSSKYGFFDTEQKVMLKAIQVYLQYLQAKKIYDISDASVRFYQKSYDQELAKLKYGESNKTNLASAEAALYYAQYQRYENQSDLESAQAQFKQIIGIDPIAVEPIELPELPDELPEFADKVLKQNLELQAKIFALKAAKTAVASSVGRLLPSVNISASYSSVKYPHQIANIDHINRKNYQGQIALNIPIFSKGGVEYSNIRTAKNKSRGAVLDTDKQKKELNAQTLAYWSSYKSLQAGMKSSDISIKSQLLAVNGINQEFNLGLKNIVDVLKTEQDLITYQTNQAKLENKYFMQVYAMKSLTGDLTGKKLGLKVKFFDPDAEIKKMKFKIIGF